jgi:hypothetical protein
VDNLLFLLSPRGRVPSPSGTFPSRLLGHGNSFQSEHAAFTTYSTLPKFLVYAFTETLRTFQDSWDTFQGSCIPLAYLFLNKSTVSTVHSFGNVVAPGNCWGLLKGGNMARLVRALGVIAAVTLMVLAAGPANAGEIINITQSSGNVDVTATGSLNLTGATFDHPQGYSTGIIPGGSNWYIALGTTAGMDWYQLTSVSLPFGTSGNYYTSSLTSGDASSIWGNGGGTPLVGVPTGYISGSLIAADMVLSGETIAGLSLIPGTYTFTLPHDTITLEIGTSASEPSTLAMILSNFAALLGVVGYCRFRKAGAVALN